MRALFIILAVVVVCCWAGFELRERFPALSVGLFTVAAVFGLLGIGAFFGMY